MAWTLLSAAALWAQSDMRDADHLRMQYEDNQVRVLWLTLPAGQSTPLLKFGEHVTVSANDAKIKITRQSGTSSADTILDIKAGETTHYDPGAVSYTNVGTGEWRCVVMEYKAHFGKAPPDIDVPGKKPTTPEPQSPRPQVQVTDQPSTPVTAPAPKPSAEPQQANPNPPPAAQQQPQAATPEPTSLNVDGAKVAFLNGTELAYIERGQGTQIVVLVHDTLGDYRSWAPQLTALAKNYRVIAYSRRYHYPNHSSGKEHDYTYDINAKELADFIRGLNAGPVRLVGFGYGASIAGMVAAEYPELVKALVITEPAYEQMLDKTMAFRSQFAREEIYGDIRKPLTKEKSDKGVQMYVDWLGYQSWAGISAEEQYRKKQNANALHAQTFDASPPNFACDTAKKITAPTLILSGQRRSPNSAEIAGVLSACVPNAERATVSNAGAAVYVDNPAEADKLLVEFLSRH